jgi:hypothetical protein
MAHFDLNQGEQTSDRVRKSLEEEEDELAKPLIFIQREKPPAQSRADRSVVSLAILGATR